MSDFNPSQHPRNDGTGEFVAVRKDADTVGGLSTAPYPTLLLDASEKVTLDEDGLEGLICICSNDASSEGFGWGDAAGKFTGEGVDPVTSICHSCGRVWRDADFDGAVGDTIRPIGRFDPYSDEFQDAQTAYWVENGFLEPEDVATLTRRVRPAASS